MAVPKSVERSPVPKPKFHHRVRYCVVAMLFPCLVFVCGFLAGHFSTSTVKGSPLGLIDSAVYSSANAVLQGSVKSIAGNTLVLTRANQELQLTLSAEETKKIVLNARVMASATDQKTWTDYQQAVTDYNLAMNTYLAQQKPTDAFAKTVGVAPTPPVVPAFTIETISDASQNAISPKIKVIKASTRVVGLSEVRAGDSLQISLSKSATGTGLGIDQMIVTRDTTE